MLGETALHLPQRRDKNYFPFTHFLNLIIVDLRVFMKHYNITIILMLK